MKQLIENSTLTKKYLKKLYKRVLKFALAEDFYTGELVVGKVYIGKLCFNIMIESTYSDIYTARGRGLTARLYVQLCDRVYPNTDLKELAEEELREW